jgi:electron transfer flavoprotein beta subunit
MRELHIIVCVKAVPKAEEIRVDPESMVIIRDGVRSEINPPDMNALEMAFQVKDEYGARVILLSMGPPFFEDYLRVGLAMGADAAFLLSDRKFGGADTLATTYTLAKGIEKIGGADLILCGEESSDGATGQVPPGLAEWLDLPQLSMVSEIKVDQSEMKITARREAGRGYEIIQSEFPVVLSVKTASNEPRFMEYPRKEWAFGEAELSVWDADALDVDEELIGIAGSPTIVTGLREAEVRDRRQEFLQGSSEEIAAQLRTILREHL